MTENDFKLEELLTRTHFQYDRDDLTHYVNDFMTEVAKIKSQHLVHCIVTNLSGLDGWLWPRLRAKRWFAKYIAWKYRVIQLHVSDVYKYGVRVKGKEYWTELPRWRK